MLLQDLFKYHQIVIFNILLLYLVIKNWHSQNLNFSVLDLALGPSIFSPIAFTYKIYISAHWIRHSDTAYFVQMPLNVLRY